MNKKTFTIILAVFVLITINICAAQDMGNTTDGDVVSTASESDTVEISNDTQILDDSSDNLLKASNDADALKASGVNTIISVESITNFDVIGDYFKIKLTDANNNVLKNTKVTFTVNGKNYDRNTDSSGIASLQIRLNDGSYNILTKFAGNSNYKASSLTTKITMDNTREVASGLSNSEIQSIIDNAKANNVILFKGNSYSDINLIITKCLTLQTNVGTTLKSSSSNPVISIKGNKASLTKVKGFTIEGNGDGININGADYVTVYGNDIAAGNGIVGVGTQYLNITKNNLVGNSKSGISIADSVSTYLFNNVINNNGANGIEVAKSDKVYIHGNTISGNGKNGISLTKTVNGATYTEGPENVYISENTITKNTKDGIIVENANNNVNINSNTLNSNKGNGISLAKIGSNKIQSNIITNNKANGIRFFDNYVKPKNQDISYNVIFDNSKEVEAKDTYYQENGKRLDIGDNWYSDYNTLCPKIKTVNIQFVVKQIGKNQFQATFLDSKGNIASLLPDRTLSYKTNDGSYISLTIKGGVATFTVDAKNGDIINAMVDDSQRESTYDSSTPNSQPVNGKTPTYSYPEIPNHQIFDDISNPYVDDGYTGSNNYGNGGGNGNGDGTGQGSGGNTNKGNGLSSQESSDNNGNSTYSHQTDPANGANNQVNDVTQSYDTQATNSPASASESSSGVDSDSGSVQQQSVAKQILIDEDEFFKITGISFIILLMILTIGFYYREDIKEMKSKM